MGGVRLGPGVKRAGRDAGHGRTAGWRDGRARTHGEACWPRSSPSLPRSASPWRSPRFTAARDQGLGLGSPSGRSTRPSTVARRRPTTAAPIPKIKVGLVGLTKDVQSWKQPVRVKVSHGDLLSVTAVDNKGVTLPGTISGTHLGQHRRGDPVADLSAAGLRQGPGRGLGLPHAQGHHVAAGPDDRHRRRAADRSYRRRRLRDHGAVHPSGDQPGRRPRRG